MNFRLMKLSQDFSMQEFMCHGIECACHGAVLVDMKLVELLQDLRNFLNEPVIVNSAFRCQVHNERVGGFPTSHHMYGLAADVTSVKIRNFLPMRVLPLDVENVVTRHLQTGQGNVILYPGRKFMHIDIGPTNWTSRVRVKMGGA